MLNYLKSYFKTKGKVINPIIFYFVASTNNFLKHTYVVTPKSVEVLPLFGLYI